MIKKDLVYNNNKYILLNGHLLKDNQSDRSCKK